MKKWFWLFSGMLAGLAAAYRYRHHLIARRYSLPLALSNVRVERNLRVPLRNGLTLAADHYRPTRPGNYPTILMRTPYARGRTAHVFGLRTEQAGWLLAGQGYHVVIQDVRGRFDSQGQFLPLIYEREDGQDTLAWLRTQPWFNGHLGMWGHSYLGYVQWALAVDNPPELKAITPGVTSSNLTLLDDEKVLRLDAALRWLIIMDAMHGHHALWQQVFRVLPPIQTRLITQAAHRLPLQTLDSHILNRSHPFYEQWLTDIDAPHPQWEQGMLNGQLRQVKTPAHLIAGWYDLFLQEQLADYATLRQGGQRPYLTVGPWAHADESAVSVTTQEGLAWLNAHLQGKKEALRPHPVRLYLMGANRWLDFDDWPPPYQSRPFYLQGGGKLGDGAAAGEAPLSTYPYDPTNPTPNLGGPLLTGVAGMVDQRPLERRPDVLTFTTAPLTHSLTLIGPAQLILYVHSDCAYTDFAGRLCVVKADGRSLNLCDGIYRLRPGRVLGDEAGVLRLEINLNATAYQFQRGEAIRLQVCSGGHPRWGRNLGTGEPTATGTQWQIATQTIYHDADHSSILLLPLVNEEILV